MEERKRIKAKIKDNVISIYRNTFPETYDRYIEIFLESIAGKEVYLVFTHGDAFEENDDNVWLPNNFWDEVHPREDQEFYG